MGRVDLASVAFDGLAAFTLGSASVVAFARDAVRSALGLMAMLAGMAGLYLMLSADFLSVVQVLVYLGCTSALLLLAALLSPADPRPPRGGAAFTMLLLAAALVIVAAGTIWPVDDELARVPSTAKVGHALLGAYVLPFELASLLLVTGLVGALVISRRAATPEGAP